MQGINGTEHCFVSDPFNLVPFVKQKVSFIVSIMWKFISLSHFFTSHIYADAELGGEEGDWGAENTKAMHAACLMEAQNNLTSYNFHTASWLDKC